MNLTSKFLIGISCVLVLMLPLDSNAQGRGGGQGNGGGQGPLDALQQQIDDLQAQLDAFAGTPGPEGPEGPDGPEGVPGDPGSQGVQGKIGPQGVPGDPGSPGSQGVQGKIGSQGVPGDPGSPGSQGVQGKVGPAGADGAGLTDGTIAGQLLQWNGSSNWVASLPSGSGSSAHTIIQPFQVLRCIIALTGTFPTVSDGDPWIGEISWVGFAHTPPNWADCDGQLLSVEGNEALFAVLGTRYGGDGMTTFALPDMRGRVPIHKGSGPGGSNYVLGQRGGSVTSGTSHHTH